MIVKIVCHGCGHLMVTTPLADVVAARIAHGYPAAQADDENPERRFFSCMTPYCHGYRRGCSLVLPQPEGASA